MGQSAWLNTSQITLQCLLAEVNRRWRLEVGQLNPTNRCTYEDELPIASLRHRFQLNRTCRIVDYGLAFSQRDRYYPALPPFGGIGHTRRTLYFTAHYYSPRLRGLAAICNWSIR
jgi:hypothetical protein